MLTWAIPDAEPFLRYAIEEITRWMGANALTITIITNGLLALKAWAVKSERAMDDRIITLLLSFFSFEWLRKLTTKKE
jgi:molybdenum cofactor biosynthesis enzyme MoaA